MGVLGSVVGMLEGGATHIAVATDHVVESFRNEMWPGYKTSAGVPEDLMEQFWPLEDALRSMGVVVWAMTDLEADDALGSGAMMAAADERVEQVLICTPDKDVAQCVVGSHVVQFDRRKRELRDEAGVVKKFGVKPTSIPDYLGLVGDSSDGFPGLPGFGPKTASTLLARYGSIDKIPDSAREWKVTLRGADKLAATLKAKRADAELFKDLATLRVDPPPSEDVDGLRWRGPRDDFRSLAGTLGAEELAGRVDALVWGLGRTGPS